MSAPRKEYVGPDKHRRIDNNVQLVMGTDPTTGEPLSTGFVGAVKVDGITEVDTIGAPITTATTNIAAGALSITIVPLTGFIGTINGTAWLDAATADALGGTYERVAQPGNILGVYTITRSAGKYSVLVSRPPT